MKLADDIAFVLRRHRTFFMGLVLLLPPLLYLLSGFYSVKPEQRAIVTRLGQIVEDNVMPGMHYHLPWPVEQKQIIPSTSLRSIAIDFDVGKRNYLQQELTTGDGNLIDVAAGVQYNITDPGRFYSATENSESLLQQLARSEVIFAVSANDFESLLTTGRNRFQKEVKESLQSRLDGLNLGVRVTSVQIQRLDPPSSIKKAFDSVSAASAEKRKLIQESRGERSAKLTRANSEVNRLTLDAQAYANEVIQQARGDQERFASLLEIYQSAPALLSNRLYIQGLVRALSESEIHIIEAAPVF